MKDRYRRLALLGQGGAGQVWLVEDELRPGARFALKELSEDSEGRAEALRREFAMLARLRHPGLVEAYDLDLSPEGELPRFTLEYVEGLDLPAVVRNEGPAALLEMTAEALRVLAFLHDFGLIHRDLKPANLLVRDRPRLGCRVVLLDLGLAVPGPEDGRSPLGGPAGTLPYLAPELFDGAAPSPRSDLYGLGVLVYEVVHGRPPFVPGERDIADFVETVREGKRARPRLPEGYHPGLAAWLDELLSPDPATRPGSALEALARLNTACSTTFPAETASSRAARLASDPPAGRDAEFAELWSILESGNRPRVVWLTAPAGGGKSRMLRWLHTEAILRGWQVTAPQPGLPLAANEASESESFLDRLRASAGGGRALLILDELESADGKWVQLLDRIAGDGDAEPLQVVAALRPGEVRRRVLRRLLDETGRVDTLRRVELVPLDGPSLRTLAERAIGSGGLSEARLKWLAATSEGNPSVAEALLVEGVWEKGGRGKRSGVLERSVLARLHLLSEHGLRWVEALAVLGSDSAEPVVNALSELSPALARDAAEESRVAGLCRVDRGRWSPDSRSVAEVVRASIEGERRVTLHRRAAELLVAERPGNTDPWRLARLWSVAGQQPQAAECARHAARQSLRDGDPDQAADRFAFALRHSDRRDPTRLMLRIQQASALMSCGRHAAAARAYGAALRLSDDPRKIADLMARQAHALVQAGRFSRSRAVAEEALARASSGGLAIERARAQKAIGMVLGRLGRESEALEPLTQALAVFRESDDLETEAETWQNLAACKARLRRDDAEADFLRAIELYRKLGKSGSELRSLLGLAAIEMQLGRLERAGRIFEDVRARAQLHGHLDLLETALSKLASLAIERGELDRALALSREARDQALRLGDRNRLMVNFCRLAEASIGCGRPAEAVDLLRDALKDSLEAVEPDMVDSARMLLAQALLETPTALEGDIRVPLEKSLDGFRKRRKSRPLLMALTIELERRARPGGGDAFEPVLDEFDALVERSAEREPEILIRRELARGAHLFHRGNLEGARESAESARTIARKASLPGYEARACGLLGETLERMGQADEAAECFREGYELLERAASAIEDVGIGESFRGRPIFRSVRRRPEPGGQAERRLVALYDMIRALNSERDPERLLESILDMALRAVSAERGMILLRDASQSDRFSVRLARNLEKETEQDAEGFSKNIVAQAGAGRSILALDAGQDTRFKDLQSVSLYGIRSLMCVPLRSRDKIVGTVYLDSRSSRTLMTPEDLRFIEAFADHAALALQNAREREALLVENRRLQNAAETRVRFGNIIGRSESMQQVFDLIEKVSSSDLPVLVQGESGTGKELVARAIHFNGPRKRKVFLSENCAAIPESLLESELFGHVRGAFTGAERERQGLFEQADGGSLFLDEVGDMSPAMQARLLRAVQEGEVRRVGGEQPIEVNVRLIAATHRDLGHEVKVGRFREDLLYRLQVLTIPLAPLRERVEDIGPLIDHFLERIGAERGRSAPRIDDDARHLLQRYPWPGNVRQLENTLQRLALLAGDAPIGISILESDPNCRTEIVGGETTGAGEPMFSFQQAARDQLRRALAAAGGNRERAARLLGVSRATIYRKIKEAGLHENH